MIAIVILGLGLLVAAAMFPIAWGKARELVEHTTVESCTAAAETAVKLSLRVDSAADCVNYTSFAGDYAVEVSTAYPSSFFISASDTWVHPLNLENVLVTSPPGGLSPVGPENSWKLSEAVRRLLGYDASVTYMLTDDPNLLSVCPGGGVNDSTGKPLAWYAVPQVLFQERVFPPVGPWEDPAVAAPEDVTRWNGVLDGRVHAWAVFHRLNEPLLHPPMSAPATPAELVQRKKIAQRPRVFTMYYVTLRRGVGQRFACQDEIQFASAPPVIKAHPHSAATPTDAKFPGAWLVPMLAPDPLDATRALNFRDIEAEMRRLGITDPNDSRVADRATRGLPTEVEIRASVSSGDDDYREFFQLGAQFIDHVNGEVYRVVSRRLDDTVDPVAAFLTLDREIFVEDLRDPARNPNPPYNEDPPTPGNENRNRLVWVSPPSTAARSAPGDPLIVEGRSPVVDIVVRSLTIHPE